MLRFEILSRNVEELQLKLAKANENTRLLQKSIREVTLKAEQSQQEAAKKHEEEKKELLRKLSDLVRRERVSGTGGQQGQRGWLAGQLWPGDFLLTWGICRKRRWK